MKKGKSIFGILVLALCFIFFPIGYALALPVEIVNSDFESSIGSFTPDSAGPYSLGIVGWSGSGTFGLWAPEQDVLATGSENGNYVGFLQNGFMTQALDWWVNQDVVYTIGIDIGNRNDGGFPENDYSVALLAGGQQLVSWTNDDLITPIDGQFGTLKLHYALTDTDFQSFAGQQLSILISSGTQLDFDNIWMENDPAGSQTAPVPEPATMLLLGTGLVGLAGVGRKRLKKKAA